MNLTNEQTERTFVEPFALPLLYEPDPDWGCIGNAENATACMVRMPLTELAAMSDALAKVTGDRDEAREYAKNLTDTYIAASGLVQSERDEARAELAKMREAIKEAHAALSAHNHTNGCCCDACHAMNGAHPRHDDLCVNTQSALAKLQLFIK